MTGRPEDDATLPVSNPAVQHWNPRAYRFLLERQTAAMRVLVVGHSPGLVRSLAADGVQDVSVLDTGEAPEESLPGDITVLRDGRLPVDDSGFHQVLVPELSRSWRALFPHELARALQPGGSMLVGAHNRLHSRRASTPYEPVVHHRSRGRALWDSVRTRARGGGSRQVNGLYRPVNPE